MCPGPRSRRALVLARAFETVIPIAAIYAFVNLATARFVVDGDMP